MSEAKTLASCLLGDERVEWEGRPDPDAFAHMFRLRNMGKTIAAMLAAVAVALLLAFGLLAASARTAQISSGAYLGSLVLLAGAVLVVVKRVRAIRDRLHVREEAAHVHYLVTTKRVLIDYRRGEVQVVRAIDLARKDFTVEAAVTPHTKFGAVNFAAAPTALHGDDEHLGDWERVISRTVPSHRHRNQGWRPPWDLVGIEDPAQVLATIQRIMASLPSPIPPLSGQETLDRLLGSSPRDREQLRGGRLPETVSRRLWGIYGGPRRRLKPWFPVLIASSGLFGAMLAGAHRAGSLKPGGLLLLALAAAPFLVALGAWVLRRKRSRDFRRGLTLQCVEGPLETTREWTPKDPYSETSKLSATVRCLTPGGAEIRGVWSGDHNTVVTGAARAFVVLHPVRGYPGAPAVIRRELVAIDATAETRVEAREPARAPPANFMMVTPAD